MEANGEPPATRIKNEPGLDGQDRPSDEVSHLLAKCTRDSETNGTVLTTSRSHGANALETV